MIQIALFAAVALVRIEAASFETRGAATRITQKILDLRHLVFTGSPLPYYYRGLLLLNVVGLMGYGVFNRV